MKKKVIYCIAAILILCGAWAAYIFVTKNNVPSPSDDVFQQSTKETFNRSRYSTDEPGSLWWIVNKKRPLPESYVPDIATAPMKLRWASDAESMQISKVVMPALADMYKASQVAGFDLMLVSGYRSAAFQKQLYDGYVTQFGQSDANRLSAKPGTSEHQTGLVVDLGRADTKCELEECFGETPEGMWLAAHAHEYGFIIRYPQGKEAIVGYKYEPWHLRYVGQELATELFNKQQTMEEFFIK